MMRNRFDRQLAELNADLIQMGNMVEQAIEMAVSSLGSRDVEKAKKTIAFDEEINAEERVIETLCFKLLFQAL